MWLDKTVLNGLVSDQMKSKVQLSLYQIRSDPIDEMISDANSLDQMQPIEIIYKIGWDLNWSDEISWEVMISSKFL